MKPWPARSRVDYDAPPFRRRTSWVWCGLNQLFFIYLFTTLLAALMQTGCVGVTSARSTSNKNPLQITTGSLLRTGAGIQFQANLTAAGGVQPYHWSIASGTLPPGLSLIPNSDAISGTASQGGQFDFSIQVSDSSSPAPQTAMKALTLSVLDCGGATAPSSSSAAGLSLVCSGTGINQAFTVELTQQFRLVFEASHNWVASQWYDLVNDPTASTNLLHTNDDRYCANTEGLNTLTFYTHSDASTGNGTDPLGTLCPPQSD